MHDNRLRGEERDQRRGVQQVELVEAESGLSPCHGQIAFLDRARVERIEVVEPHDGIAPGQQPLHQMGADESRSPGDENLGHRER